MKHIFWSLGNTLLLMMLCASSTALSCVDPALQETPLELTGEKGESDDGAIMPDPVIQAAIDGLLHPETEDQLKEHMRFLRAQSSDSYQKLVLQLIYYSMHGDDVVEAMAFPIIVERLEISKYFVVNGLIPYLDTQHAELKKEVREILSGVEDRSSSRPPDYSHYGAIIETSVREGKELPRELILYMYESDPGTAVIRVMRSSMLRKPSEVKPILWAEHLVTDVLWKWRYDFLERSMVEPEAVEALQELSENPRWWARLYVAEIMRQHPPFRTDELIEALIADPDESVRSVMESFAATDPGA